MLQKTNATTGAAASSPYSPAPTAEQGVIQDNANNSAMPTENKENPTNNVLTINMQSCEELNMSQDQKTFDRKKHKEDKNHVNIMDSL